MIKRTIIFAAVALILSVALLACTNNEKKAEDVTRNFLDAYFNVDYEKVAVYCTEELGESLVQSFKSMESLDPQIREMVVQNSSKTKTEIVQVDSESKKDTIIVLYKVFPDNFPDGIDSKLSLVQSGKEWKIAELGF